MCDRISQAKELASDSVVLLAGNKTDLTDDRTVSQEEAQDFADSENVPYYEISSKDNINITEMFEAIVDKAYQAVNPEPKTTEQPELELEPREPDSEPEPDESDELRPAGGQDSTTVRPRDEDHEQEKSSGCNC